MSKKKNFTKDLVTPDEVLSNWNISLLQGWGRLLLRSQTNLILQWLLDVVLCAQKKQMTCFR